MILLVAPCMRTEKKKKKKSKTIHLSIKKIIFMVDETPRQGRVIDFPITGTPTVISLQLLQVSNNLLIKYKYFTILFYPYKNNFTLFCSTNKKLNTLFYYI